MIEIGTEDRIISSYELMATLSEEKAVKFYADLPSIDDAIEGFEPGELYTLSGPTKNGKSTVFQMLTCGFERGHYPSLWFSYEIPPKQLIKRFRTLPLFYLPKTIKGSVLSYLDAKIKEAKALHGVKIVFVDHLHYIVDLAQANNVSIQIGQVIRGLKRLAIENEVVIFLAAHTTKLVVNADKEPSDQDIRDSSMIGQESDCIMMMWRLKDSVTDSYGNQSILKIQYHRRIGLLDKKISLIFKDCELHDNGELGKKKEWENE